MIYPTKVVHVFEERAGLDIDGVLCNFQKGFLEQARALGLAHRFPATVADWTSWMPSESEDFIEVWRTFVDDDSWWLSLDPLPVDLLVRPALYCTARSVESRVTAAWIAQCGFPEAPVVTVGPTESKLSALRAHQIDFFVDDKPETFVELNQAGLRCYLYNTSYNKDLRDDGLRIYALSELASRHAVLDESLAVDQRAA